jgi:hypothetical protein
VQGDPSAWAGHGDLLRSAPQAATRLDGKRTHNLMMKSQYH